MSDIIKQVFKPVGTCMTFFSFIILAIVGLMLINPNAISQLIQDTLKKTVLKQTDNTVLLNGPLHWTLLPQISITADDVHIHHPKEHKQLLLAIKSIRLQPDVWRLLLGDYSGTIDAKLNNLLTLKTHTKWSSDEKQFLLHNILLQYGTPLSRTFHVADSLHINTQQYTMQGQLKSTEFENPIFKIYFENPQHIQLSIAQGHIPGIGLMPLLQHAQTTIQSFIKSPLAQQILQSPLILNAEFTEWKTQTSMYPEVSTPFDALQATLSLENGMLTNTDLQLTQGDFKLEGRGTLNLTDGTLNYQTKTMLSHMPADLNPVLSQLPLHVSLTGTLDNLLIHPELTTYFQSAIKQIRHSPTEPKLSEEHLKMFENLFEMH